MAATDWLSHSSRNGTVRAVRRGAAAALVLAVALLVLDDASIGDAVATGAVFVAGYLFIHATFRWL